jgi:head-tail adaptor
VTGSLRHKVELLAAARTADEAGGASIAWSADAEIWARVERLTSTRDFSGDRDNRLKRIAVTVRWRAGLSLGARVRFEDADYEIVSIESDDGRERRVTLVCEEVL